MYTYIFVLDLYMGRALHAFCVLQACVAQRKPTH